MKKLTPEDIKKIPWIKNCPRTTFSDDEYNLVKESWVFEKFYPWFEDELDRYHIKGWHKRFDCDDFASLFRILAQVCHLQSGGSAKGLGIGEIFFESEKLQGPHAINAVLVENGPIFIEPQTGKKLELTQNEKNSIYRVRF